MKFILASLILFLGMYAFAEQDELEALLEQSTCSVQDLRGPEKAVAACSTADSKNELDSKLSSAPDEELEIE